MAARSTLRALALAALSLLSACATCRDRPLACGIAVAALGVGIAAGAELSTDSDGHVRLIRPDHGPAPRQPDGTIVIIPHRH